VDFNPNASNLKSKAKFVTCYIELPSGYNAKDIDASSVSLTKLNGELLGGRPHAVGPSEIGDYDKDGIRDLTVKFGTQVLLRLLEVGDRSIDPSRPDEKPKEGEQGEQGAGDRSQQRHNSNHDMECWSSSCLTSESRGLLRSSQLSATPEPEKQSQSQPVESHGHSRHAGTAHGDPVFDLDAWPGVFHRGTALCVTLKLAGRYLMASAASTIKRSTLLGFNGTLPRV